jgi:hypothetical protein
VTKVFISGPITGHDEPSVRQAFNCAERKIKEMNLTPINPVVVQPSPSLTDKDEIWADCMRKTIAMLLKSNAIYMLPKWQDSKGASLERQIGSKLRIPVYYSLDSLYILTEGNCPQKEVIVS